MCSVITVTDTCWYVPQARSVTRWWTRSRRRPRCSRSWMSSATSCPRSGHNVNKMIEVQTTGVVVCCCRRSSPWRMLCSALAEAGLRWGRQSLSRAQHSSRGSYEPSWLRCGPGSLILSSFQSAVKVADKFEMSCVWCPAQYLELCVTQWLVTAGTLHVACYWASLLANSKYLLCWYMAFVFLSLSLIDQACFVKRSRPNSFFSPLYSVLYLFSSCVCLPKSSGFNHCRGNSHSLLSLTYSYLVTLIVAQLAEGQVYCFGVQSTASETGIASGNEDR